jgi:hypothetical protein
MDSNLTATVNENGRPTVHYVAAEWHLYTVKSLTSILDSVGMDLTTWNWSDMLQSERLPWGLWVLSDFDRIPAWWLEIAARRYALLTSAQMTVLNDPRRFLHRAAFIRQMWTKGHNSFDCWLPAFGEVPYRYPVFLRTILAHRGTISDLLPDAQAARAALEDALAAGHPLANLCFVEYRAAPTTEGVFRKFAAYRVGDQIVGALSVNERGWHAKFGSKGAASDVDYAQERREMIRYPHEAAIRLAFDVAGLSYGRADFAIVNGRIEVYEINTNPFIGTVTEHPNADRLESNRLSRDGLGAAFAKLFRPSPPDLVDGHIPVPPDPRPLGRQP